MLSTQALLSRILALLLRILAALAGGSRVNQAIYNTIENDVASPLALAVPIPDSPPAEGKYCVMIENRGNHALNVSLQNGTLFGDAGTMSYGDLISPFDIPPNERVDVPVNSWLIGDAAQVVLASDSNISASVEVRSL